MLNEVNINIPASDEDISQLTLGSVVYLNGIIYTAREGVYDRILSGTDQLPVGLTNKTNANFHCSPAAAVNDDGSYEIGGVTATASFRFSKYIADWLDLTNTKIVIGKGGMPADDYQTIFAPRGAIYLTTVGYGTGALLGRGVVGVESVHWLDQLGIAQAMWMFKVEKFGPFLVDSDLDGNSLFAQQGELINKNLSNLYKGLKVPALHRFGETNDREDELM